MISQDSLKQTPLYQKHIGLHARMVGFGGWDMPLQYEGIIVEYESTRKQVTVFDTSHMGEFILKGDKAVALIQAVTSNDASVLMDGKAQYSCLPNEEGGIVDDLIVYKMEDDKYFVVVNIKTCLGKIAFGFFRFFDDRNDLIPLKFGHTEAARIRHFL